MTIFKVKMSLWKEIKKKDFKLKRKKEKKEILFR